MKGLVESFFHAVDAALGTEYVSLCNVGRRTAKRLVPDMCTLASRHVLGVLFFDELQELERSPCATSTSTW
jgi:hypothetical protein